MAGRGINLDFKPKPWSAKVPVTQHAPAVIFHSSVFKHYRFEVKAHPDLSFSNYRTLTTPSAHLPFIFLGGYHCAPLPLRAHPAQPLCIFSSVFSLVSELDTMRPTRNWLVIRSLTNTVIFICSSHHQIFSAHKLIYCILLPIHSTTSSSCTILSFLPLHFSVPGVWTSTWHSRPTSGSFPREQQPTGSRSFVCSSSCKWKRVW